MAPPTDPTSTIDSKQVQRRLEVRRLEIQEHEAATRAESAAARRLARAGVLSHAENAAAIASLRVIRLQSDLVSLPRTLDSLVEYGLTLQAVSALVGCSYVTLYRARKGRPVSDATAVRLRALRHFCIDPQTINLLSLIARTFRAEHIWKVGLAQLIEEKRPDEPA